MADRILIAPDSFKGTLSAPEVCDAIARGVGARAVCDRCPLADGGEGTAAILAEALGADRGLVAAEGPMGEPVEAAWFLASHGAALLDAASVIGLPLVPPATRDVMRASSAGLGELIRAAVDAGARRVEIGLGGVATVDAGIGMLGALGWRFFDARGSALEAVAPSLDRVSRAEAPGSIEGVEVSALCDVRTPLVETGGGAARVFGPQKGASAEQVGWLERAHGSFAAALGAGAMASAPMSGAAGGLGWALAACLGAELRPGIERVWEAVGGEDRLGRADLVITGEGRLDEQSAMGKVAGFVAERARAAGVPVVAICGDGPADPPARMGLAGLVRLVDLAGSEREATERAGAWAERAAGEVVSGWLGRS